MCLEISLVILLWFSTECTSSITPPLLISCATLLVPAESFPGLVKAGMFQSPPTMTSQPWFSSFFICSARSATNWILGSSCRLLAGIFDIADFCLSHILVEEVPSVALLDLQGP